MKRQKLTGILLLLVCAVNLVLAYGGTGAAERDVTAVLLLFPLSVFLLVTRQPII